MGAWLSQFSGTSQVRVFVYLLGLAAFLIFAGAGWLFKRSGDPDSQFRVRESDLPRPQGVPGDDRLAQARIARNEPLRLAGIRIDGPPHEILGVSSQATEEEIQRAYRERMKQYHPDKVGAPGSREWTDAQKIAEAIIRAKEELIKRLHSQRPNRSGR